jgi:hypothetical protein
MSGTNQGTKDVPQIVARMSCCLGEHRTDEVDARRPDNASHVVAQRAETSQVLDILETSAFLAAIPVS